MTDQDAILEPCQCGAAAKRSKLEGLGMDQYRVRCSGVICKASTAWCGDPETADAAWNTRTQAAVPSADVGKITEIIGTDGKVHYRRPLGDPLIEEAKRTPGYSVRIAALPQSQAAGAGEARKLAEQIVAANYSYGNAIQWIDAIATALAARDAATVSAVEAERERCAKVARTVRAPEGIAEHAPSNATWMACRIAAYDAIRTRQSARSAEGDGNG